MYSYIETIFKCSMPRFISTSIEYILISQFCKHITSNILAKLKSVRSINHPNNLKIGYFPHYFFSSEGKGYLSPRDPLL